ncbi:MAG: fibronectin type III domain-containing protein [Bacteroidota bacterium]
MKNWLFVFILLLFAFCIQAAIPERTGWWKFENPSGLLAAEPGYGADLVLTGSHAFTSGPEEGNGAALIGPGSYYTMRHGISPSGQDKFVNEYSLLFDFKIPDTGIWHSFFQTGVKNNTDGDFFINPSGNIGVAAVGYSSFTISKNEWYRLVISVRNGDLFDCYLDGDLLMTGEIQSLDGRFSLDSLLLLFADENNEDGDIVCSELSIWNRALNGEQAKELGGYGHTTGMPLMTRIPFLQSPGQNSMTISWHDTATYGTSVEYGTDSIPDQTEPGASETIQKPYRWHTVKLSGLEENTVYFYRVKSGKGESKIYSFKTLPGTGYAGKIRFVLLSDTHASDTTMAGEVLRAARSKICELYGPDIENHVIGIFHSGDITVSGNSAGQYTSQFFGPVSALSSNIATMTVAGNHEGESPLFYAYMKLDELSAFPANPALSEKIWKMTIGNSLFIGLNTNMSTQFGDVMSNWLDGVLNDAEQDPAIDFVFLFFHHPPFSELWFDVSTFDGGADYVRYELLPVFKKYSKVQQFHTGHTHGFERGTINSPLKNADFRSVCGGGGGGPLDTWGAFTNFDYDEIHIALDHYCFQILEIDIAEKSFQTTMYSLGNLKKPGNSEALDTWYRKLNQEGPDTPVVENIDIAGAEIRVFTSEFSGADSLMSVNLQVVDQSSENAVVLDTLLHWTDIYGVDESNNPIDKNSDLDLYQPVLDRNRFGWDKSYGIRVRYRDHNLKWSEWSDDFLYSTIGIETDKIHSDGDFLDQNFPNPFQGNTTIVFHLMESAPVEFRIYDTELRLVDQLQLGVKNKGTFQIDYQGENLENGMYYYTIMTDAYSATRKMVKIF